MRAAPVWLGAGGLLVAGTAQAVGEDDLEQRTVRIGCFVQQQGKVALAGTGSGFLIADARHVVTNHHVVQAKACQQGVAAVMLADKVLPLTLLGSSQDNDLALLRSDEDVPGKRPVEALVRAADLATRDEVHVLGFPGVVDSMASGSDALRPTTTRGIIGRRFETDRKTGMLQVDARTEGGSSGGPWFDACGRVVGVHSAGAYRHGIPSLRPDGKVTVERLPVGYGYAIQTDHLLPLLDAAGVRYTVAGRCGFVARHGQLLAWSAAALAGGAYLVQRSPLVVRLRAQPPGAATPTTAPRRPHLVGLSGSLRDRVVEFGDGPIVIGRDPRVSNLVLPASCDDISKRHALLQLGADGRGFVLEDCWSINGCYLASGERLVPGSRRELLPGSRFYLASTAQMFELRAATGAGG